MKKTYIVKYWVWNATFEEYEPEYIKCEEDKKQAIAIYNQMSVSMDIPRITVVEYQYINDDEFIGDKVIEEKEL